MEVAGSSGAKDKSILAAQAEDVLVESDSSELSVSTASNSTLKPDGGMTTDPERRQRRQARREAKAKRKEDEKLAAKKKRRRKKRRSMMHHQVSYHLVRMMVMMMNHITAPRRTRRANQRRRTTAAKRNTPLYPLTILICLTETRSVLSTCPLASCLISMGPTLLSGSI